MESIKLTQYSHGAGCGCKISPSVLDEILSGASTKIDIPQLLVGNDEKDDAAVYDMEDGTSIISTTDFFMPIVDDPEDFGRIAAVNAISDIYAMGGSPMMAIAILGWPIDKLSPKVAGQVVEGGRKACAEAGIPLAGGHSIDCPEPIFGLAVTGKVATKTVKKNGGAQVGDLLYLTKSLGVGILSTAQKQNKLKPEHADWARNSMVQLNKSGAYWGEQSYIHAMTDVTGFGLMGHLREMCEASGTGAMINLDDIPFIDMGVLLDYVEAGCVPGGTIRNFKSYGHIASKLTESQKALLCDPQTSGGLLLAVDPKKQKTFEHAAKEQGLELEHFGKMVEKDLPLITVR